MPTPARRATSSREASGPCSVNAAAAASIRASRLRCASARLALVVVVAEAGSVAVLMTTPPKGAGFSMVPHIHLQTGGSLRIVTGGALHLTYHPSRRPGMATPTLTAGEL